MNFNHHTEYRVTICFYSAVIKRQQLQKSGKLREIPDSDCQLWNQNITYGLKR